MIDHQLPKNWKDLQVKVAEIFREIGYSDVETDKKLDLVRGDVNVDVYAVDNTQSQEQFTFANANIGLVKCLKQLSIHFERLCKILALIMD